MTKKYQPCIIFLEHDTKAPIRKKLKTSGFGGLGFAKFIAGKLKDGYRLVNVEGNPKDPIYQYIRKQIDDFQGINQREILGVAKEVTGAKISAIKDKAKQMMERYQK